MASNGPTTSSHTTTINRIIRNEWGRLLASLTRTLGDLQLAEDCLQDAVERALHHWSRDGLPKAPAGWLLQTARRRAIDHLRRNANFKSKEAEITALMEMDAVSNQDDLSDTREEVVPDERLRLIFTCCHPALDDKSAIALTLRCIAGLTTEEIAQAFLDKTSALAARLTRAKKKIALAGIPYELPKPEDLEIRLRKVLTVVYLIYNEGYQASSGDRLQRQELTSEAHRLIGYLCDLLPNEAEPKGLAALILLHDSRRSARQSPSGEFIPLEFQDRTLWDQAKIGDGTTILKSALQMGKIGPYQIQAAISACHGEAVSWADTDWAQIAALYDLLNRMTPSPVIALNGIYARSHSLPLENTLEQLSRLSGELDAYQPFHATKADILARAGRSKEAIQAYDRAISLSNNQVEREFLKKKCKAISST